MTRRSIIAESAGRFVYRVFFITILYMEPAVTCDGRSCAQMTRLGPGRRRCKPAQPGRVAQYINGNNTLAVLIRNYLKTRNNDKNYTCRLQNSRRPSPAVQLG